MSAFAINEICYRLCQDPGFRAALKADPAAATAEADLTPAEREAFLAGDVAALFRDGAHPFLIAHLARYQIVGLNILTYNERIRSLQAG